MVAAMFPSTVFAETGTGDLGTSANTEIVTNAPEEKTPDTEGNETPDVVTDEDTDTDETDQGTDETKKNEAVTNTEEKTPAEGTKPEETKVEETKPEQPTVPETTPTNEALGIDPASLEPQADVPSAEPTTVSTAYDLRTAINNAKAGDTIYLAATTIELPADNSTYFAIDKQVNIKGAGKGQTILTGAGLAFGFGNGDVTVSDLTMKGNGTGTALNFQGDYSTSDGQTATGTYTVSDCAFEGFSCTIGVNSSAVKSTLVLQNCEFNDIDYAVGVQESNTVEMTGTTVSGGYAVQYFTSDFSTIGYYPTYEEYAADKEKGTYAPPIQDGANNHVVFNVAGLKSAIDSAKDGDTITLAAGDYNIGTLTIGKAVNIVGAGAGETVLTGNLKIAGNSTDDSSMSTAAKTINVSGITMKPADGASNNWGLYFGNGYNAANYLNGWQINVTDSAFEGWEFAICLQGGTVSSAGMSNNTLTVKNCTFDDVFCATSVDSKVGRLDADNSNFEPSEGFYANQTYGIPDAEKDNLYYSTVADVKAMNPAVSITSSEQGGFVNGGYAVAVLNEDGTVKGYYGTLQAAVDAIEDNQGTIRLNDDVALNAPVEVPEGMNLTVEGNGHTITLPESAPYSAFNNTNASTPGEMEGLKGGTTLTVDGVNFVGDVDGTNSGHAVVVGSDGGVTVTLKNCGFTNMYDALYCNNISNGEAQQTTVSITGSTFTNVHYSYSVDDGATDGALTGKHDFTLTGNTNEPQPETFAVAKVGNVGYDTLAEAIANAGEGDTVTLLKDAKLDSMLTIDTKDLTLDLGGNKIYADDSFTDNNTESTNDNHLVDVVADGVTITNGTLEAGKNNNHTLNVWNADGVTVSGVTLDGSAAGMGGAPLIVGGSDVTLEGKITFITGENSWYGANVDTRKVNGEKTPAKLTLGENAEAFFTGTNHTGIYVENSANFAKPGKLEVAFEEGSSITSDIDPFTAIVFSDEHNASSNTTVTNPENAGLITDANGNYVPKPAPAPSKPSTGSSHEHSYVWQGSPDEHWQYCTECGQVVSNGAHTFQWKDGVQVCSVCGYKLTQTSSTSTAPAGSTAAATAAPAAGTTATAATGIPQTSDNSNPMLCVVLLVLSGSALGGMTIYKKKKEN